MKSVAIIGAGPAGIIAARKLLQVKKFTVHVFEKADEIGGSWAPGNIINPEMRTNQSKFTMSFSDLSWESIVLPGGESAPVYPKASQVFDYLKAYCERYLPPNQLHLGTEVRNVEQISTDREAGYGRSRWKLELHQATTGNSWQRSFDYLIAAPGIYSVPKRFSVGVEGEETDLYTSARVPVMHNTRYRKLSDLQHHGPHSALIRKKILVVGGSHSGAEVADLVARQLSDVNHSTIYGEYVREWWKNTEVAHVSSHEMFGFPAITRDLTASLCTFQPIDFMLFNRSSRPIEPPPSFTYGLVTPEKVAATRRLLHTILNGNEGELDGRQADQLAPVAVLGDLYTQFVKTGQIVQTRGTLERFSSQEDDHLLTATVRNYTTKELTPIKNVCAVIHATGFDSTAPFSIFDEKTTMALDFDSACSLAPIILDCNVLTQNSLVPTFAMVGLKGAYWGIFEMQARSIVQAWTKQEGEIPHNRCQTPAGDSKLRKYYQQLRAAVKEGKKHEIPSNPFGDEVGAMEQASRELGLERFDLGFSESQGFVCSSRYLDPGSGKQEAIATLTEVQRVQREARDSGLFLARAVALGLLGNWVAASKDADGSGSVKFVQRSFGYRSPTDPVFTLEYLAEETENGVTIDRKVYRYAEATDRLTVWDTQPGGLCTGPLVMTLDFKNAAQTRGKDTAVAVGIPLGHEDASDIEDLQTYRFHFAGSSLQMWTAGKVGSTSRALNFVRVGRG